MKLFVLIAALVAAVLALPKHALGSRDARDNPDIPNSHDQDFISTVLNAHWYWRRVHCAQDLQWNHTLAELARNDVRTCTRSMEHMRGGSNLSGSSPPPNKRQGWLKIARDFIHGWHEEESFYDYTGRKSKNDRQIFHFTQLVWRDSSQLGCAITDCSDVEGATFPARLYCYYDPIGNNVAGNFMAENVWPPVCADPSRGELEARFGF
ncbi:PR-1-like protein [Bimuria novae-zelandiae CBS 107.79]|uniref:PR-1-like protein n=1 Tax=Bimuria novae-zelandiae CBS 107.79 TaxID=1447943 RepID=A0A6A5UTZ3_9PLEO|nr:PR-1-like protein [Bimuria novae-zelandiae CBS 107.79]